MDYVAPDSTPAGYNTAVLAEISKRIGKNIELVVVESAGRAAALSSGTVDAVFWTRSNNKSNGVDSKSEKDNSETKEKNLSKQAEEQKDLLYKLEEIFEVSKVSQNDMSEGTIITEPYFRDSLVPVTTMEQLESMKINSNKGQ